MVERTRGSARDAVLATHQGFYDAIEGGDLDLMTSLWADDDAAVCVHPGTEALVGAGVVRRSWAMVMAQLGYVQFILTDVQVTLLPDDADPVAAVVSCTENVLVEASDGSDAGFAGGRAVATKTLVRRPGGWRVLTHHASPVLEPDDEDDDEDDAR